MERTLLFIIALVAGTHAGPIQDIAIGNTCAGKCTVSSKFNYEPGTTYEFKYENEIRTAVQGASEDHAGLTMSATVNIDFLTKCEAVMKLSDVVMKEHDPATSKMKVVSIQLKPLLEKDPLGFSFQDGQIEQICLADVQDVKILNIKRGILSMLQNNMDDISKAQTVKESDVAGTCDTEYSSADKGWYNVVVTKSKHMLSCTDRHNSNTALQGIPYDSQSKIQSLPLVKSSHTCEQEFVRQSGKLVSATCREHITLAPFSREQSGATTHNTQHLTFVKQSKTSSKPVTAAIQTSLHYDHSTSNKLTNSIKEMQDKLEEVCKTTENGVKPDTPRLFTSLIYTMKKMEAAEMSSILQKIKNKAICSGNNDRVRKFFLDAIPMTGTPASLKMMTQLLVRQEVTGMEADMWLTTIAFIQTPSIGMLSEIKPLLTMKTNEEKVMLSVSSLVHSICRNDAKCDNYLEVRKIISLLENKIAPACKVTSKTMQPTLLALRAIGNAGFGTSAIPTLRKCIMQSKNPIEVRLSAIEAFRRIPCHSDKSTIMTIFKDTEEDSEIRIAAYKTLMECPSTEVLRKIKTMLSQEEVNQVGSYVWSHLTNLMETSDPHKQDIRLILQDATLQKEFDMDKRKFSRNYEGSVFVEKINTGATIESDMIWSSKSFIPRSAMVNLTVDLFGNAVNLLEIGGRIEGLEYFMESYFGPNGYFSENDVQDAVDETAVQTIKADKANRINKRMNTVMDDLRGSLYLRVFGNELGYMNFEGVDTLLSSSFNVLDMLMKLSQDKEYQYSHSSMFMDSSLMIPTYSGFPMNLTVNGIATIDVKASGKVDVMKMSTRPRGMDVHGMIKPSAALEVTTTMSVDALVTKVGLKMVSSLYTSSILKGKVSLADGSILDMELDLPEDKMEILNVKSSFFTVHRDLEREQRMITDNKQSSEICTGKSLAKNAGIEICGRLSYPNASMVEEAPYFPLTGPVSASVILNKRDTLTGYKLEARSTHTSDSNILRLAFSTPKAKIDRTFGIDINLNKKEGTLDMSMDSPMKQANFAGNYQFSKKSMGISGKVNIDNTLRYEVKAGIDAEKSGPGMMYTPVLNVKVPGQSPVDLSGKIKYAPWKIVDIDMTLSGIVKPPVNMQVSYLNKLKMVRVMASAAFGKKQEYSIDASCQKSVFKKKVEYKPQISVRTPAAEVLTFGGSYTNVFGNVIKLAATLDKLTSKPIVLKKAIFGIKQYSKGRKLYNFNMDLRSAPMDLKMRSKFDNRNMKTLATDTDITYIIRKVARDNIKVVSKITNLSSKALTKIRSTMNFASKRSPWYNFKTNANLESNKRLSKVDAEISYGADAKDTNKKISGLISLDNGIRSWSKANAEFNVQFIRGNDIRFVSKIKHAQNKQSLESSASVRLNKNAITTSLSLKDQSAELKQLSGQFELSMPGKTISISQTINETSPSEFASVMNARVGKAQNSIQTTWKRISPSAVNIKANINLHNIEKIVVTADYNFSPKLYKVSGSLTKGSNKYSASSQAEVDMGHSLQLSTDIVCPSRRIIANVEHTKQNDIYSTRADFRWNADRDDSQRLVIKNKGTFSGLNNIDVSLTIHYPDRNIAVNLKHFSGSKYVSHFDMQWEPKELYSIETVFGNYNNKNSREIEGQFKLSTPFKVLKSVEVHMHHNIESSEYTTQLDIEWNPKQIISSTMTVKRPFSINNIDVQLKAKSPFAAARQVQVSLRHKARQGIATVGKVTWNKQYVQVDLTLDDLSNMRQRDLKAEVNLKTSNRAYKTAKGYMTYFNDGNKLESSMILTKKKFQYGIISSLKHSVNGWSVNNNGDIRMFNPTDEIKLTWDHSNTLNDISSSTEVTWGGNQRVFVKYSGLQNFKGISGSLSSALEIQTTFKDIKDVVAQITHEHRRGQIDSVLKVMNDGTKVVSAEGKYLRQDGQVKSSIVISNPFSVGDLEAKLESDCTSFPKTIHLQVNLSPMKKLTIDGSFDQNNNVNMDSSLSISSPSFDTVLLKGIRTSTPDGIKTEISLNYSPGKVISVHSLHRLGNDKLFQIKLQSPYTDEYTAEVGATGTVNNFQAMGSIEALPYLPKWTASGTFNVRSGMTLKVTTPYPNVAYSQITIRSEEVNGDRTSSITIEYLPGKMINLISAYNFENPRNIKLSVGLETPFKGMPKSILELSHRGTVERFANHILLEYNPGKRMSMDTTFSRNDGIDGTIVIAMPWTSTIKGMMKHTGSLSDFTTHGEISWKDTTSIDLSHKGSFSAFASGFKVASGTKSMSANIDFARGTKTTTNINIRTPFKQWKDLKITHSFEGISNKFTNQLELFASKYGTFSSDFSIDVTSKLYGEISIQTPLKGYQNLKALVSHQGSLNNFGMHVEIQNGNDKVIGDVKLSTNPAVNFVVAVKTPIAGYKFIQMTWTHDGSMKNFKSNLELQMNKATSEIDISYSFIRKLNLDIAIRSPYSEAVKISVDHWGKVSRFTNKIRVRAGKQKVSTEITFQLNPSLDAQITVKSPFPYLKNHQLSIKHAGSMNSFKCNMQYKCNGKIYIGDASFDNIDSIKADINMKGPTFRPINVAFDFTPDVTNFKSNIQASIGKKTIAADANLNTLNGIKGNMKITSPFEVLESMSASIAHDGSVSSFQCRGDMSYNKKKGSAIVSFDNTKDLSASLQIDTPFRDYKSITSSLRTTSNELIGLYKVNDKSIDLNASYKNDLMTTLSTTLNSQFQYIPSIDTSFTLSANKLSIRGEITCGQEKIDFDAALDATKYGYTGTLSTNMPWIKRTTLDFNHELTGESLTFAADTTYGGLSKFNVNSDIHYKSPFNIDIEIKTALKNFETTKLSVIHSNEDNSIRSEFKLSMYKDTHEGKFTLLKNPNIEGKLSLNSPLIKDFDSSVTVVGTPTNFKSQTEIKYGRESQLNTQLDINIEGPFEGDLEIISPHMKNIKATFSHDALSQNLRSNAMVQYAGQKTEFSVSCKLNGDPELVLKLTSPFTQDLEMTLSRTGDIDHGVMAGDILHGGQSKFSLHAHWNTFGSVDGKIEIKTPITGLRSMMATYGHQGSAIDFNTNAELSVEDHSALVEMSFNPPAGSILVHAKTSFNNDLRISCNSNDDIMNLNAKTLITYNDVNMFEIVAETELNNHLTGSVIVKVPDNEASFAATLIGQSYKQFNGHMETAFNSHKAEGDMSFASNGKIEALLSLKSTLTAPFSAKYSYANKQGKHEYSGEVVYDSNRHALDIELDLKRKVFASIDLVSPLIQPLKASGSLTGVLTNFEAEAQLLYGYKQSRGNVLFNIETAYKGEIHFVTPLTKPVVVSFEHKGYVPNFTSMASAEYGDDTLFDAEVSFSRMPLKGRLQIKTSLPGYESVTASFSQTGNKLEFEHHSEIDISGEKTEIDISLNAGSKMEGTIVTKSPYFPTIETGFKITGTLNNFESSADFTYDGFRYSVETNFDISTKISASFKVLSPINGYRNLVGTLSHTGVFPDINSYMQLKSGRRNLALIRLESSTQNGVTAIMTIKTVLFPAIQFNIGLNTDKNGFNSKTEFKYNGMTTSGIVNLNIEPSLEGSFTFTSPWKSSTGNFKLDFDQNNINFNTELELDSQSASMTLRYQGEKDMELSFTIKTPFKNFDQFEGSIKYQNKNKGLGAEISLELPSQKRIEFNTQYHGTSGSYMLRTPWKSSSGNFNLDIEQNNIGLKAGAELDSRSVSLNVKYEGDEISFTVITPFKSFEQFKGSAKYQIRHNGLGAEMNLELPSQEKIEFNAQYRGTSGSYRLTSPWKSSSGNFKLNFGQKNFELKAETGLDSRSASVHVKYEGDETMDLSFTVKTPFKNFEQFKGGAKYQNRYDVVGAEMNLELPSQEKIEFNAQYRGINGKVSLKTPFNGYTYSSLETKYEGKFPNVIYDLSLSHSGQEYSIKGELDSTSGKLSVATPFEGYENTILTINKQGTITNLRASLRLTTVNNQIFASIENKLENNRLETKALLESPFTDDITFELSHSWNRNAVYNSVLIAKGQETSMNSKTNLRRQGTKIDFETSLSTVTEGVSDEQKIKLTYEKSLRNFEISLFAKLMGSEYSFESSLNTDSAILGKLSLKTPFTILKSMSLLVDQRMSPRKFETSVAFELNDETLSGEFSFEKYDWRRFQTTVVVKSTIKNFEHSTATYMHTATVDSFECDIEARVFKKDFSGNIQVSKAPWSAKLTISTPFKGYEQIGSDVKLDIGDGHYNAEANIALIQDKTISLSSNINLKESTKTVQILLTTPFSGYETSELSLTHTGDAMNFQSVASVSASYMPSMRAQANLRSFSIFDFDGSVVFNSQIKNLENLKFSLKNEPVRDGVYKSRLESSWTPTKTFLFNSELTYNRNSINADISLSSPFSIVRQLSAKSEFRVNRNLYFNSLLIKHNDETCVDMDLNIIVAKRSPSVTLSMRNPTLLTTIVGGSFGNGYYKGHIKVNKDFKIEGTHDVNALKTELKYTCPRHTILLNTDFNPTNPKADIVIDNERYGYEILMTNVKSNMKIILPSRSIKISGSQNQGMTEGMLMWDADNDESKMVAIKSTITRLIDSMKADITLQMPSLGKDVHIDSEMVLNRGKVIFEGKTDLKYSKDSRKTITLTSRLLDISNDWKTQNYSFSLGVQHPFTTVDVKLASHIGKSNTEFTGGVDVEYLTSRRQTKTFSVNGELNKLRSSAKFNMDTPLKTISISGDSRMEAPFSVSLVNQYDNIKPIRTVFTLDPKAKKLDFQMNYDIDNPKSEFHINAKYVNRSAILSEIFHVGNRQKTTDALLFLRLNSSSLLHSRIHWRPAMIGDLKEFVARKGNGYKVRLSNLVDVASESLLNEFNLKSSMIKRSFKQEMRPFTDILERESEKMMKMYETNAYHIRDISMVAVDYTMAAKLKFEHLAELTGEHLQHMKAVSLDLAENVILKIEDRTINLINGVTPIFEPLYNMTRHPAISYMTSLPQRVPSMADTYTSAIYNARDQISSKLSSVLQRDDIKYVQSYTSPVMVQGMNAYKYWEIRQNAGIIMDAVLDVIQSEIEEELSELKASLFNLRNTHFTVYDPANGEVQLEVHLPIPVKYLDEIPVFDVAPYINKARRYAEFVPKLPQISTDINTWLPPFNGYATIHGDQITTFDGTHYDLDGSCSFLLAKDFVDGNFSVVLHKKDDSKSLLIMADGKAITILNDGKVLVNDKVIETSVTLKNIEISINKVETVVKGAGSFEVIYLPSHDLTTIKINGWYFGKTNGLLGTYDNEPSNDLMSSYGRQVNNPSRFARTWDMSLTKCR